MQLHVFQGDRSALLQHRYSTPHGSVQGTGSQDTVEDAVVVQPGWIRGEDLRFERDLSAGGLAAFPEQLVPGGAPMLPGRFDPVTLALEGITRQGDSPPGFSGEESFEAYRLTGFVYRRYRLKQTAFLRLRVSLEGLLRLGTIAGAGVCGESGQAETVMGARIAMRTDLHDQIHAECGQCADTLCESHGFPRVPFPVGPVEQVIGCYFLSGQIADDRDRGRIDRDAIE